MRPLLPIFGCTATVSTSAPYYDQFVDAFKGKVAHLQRSNISRIWLHDSTCHFITISKQHRKGMANALLVHSIKSIYCHAMNRLYRHCNGMQLLQCPTDVIWLLPILCIRSVDTRINGCDNEIWIFMECNTTVLPSLLDYKVAASGLNDVYLVSSTSNHSTCFSQPCI